MNMEEIIRSWKADGEALEPHLPASPVGQELSEEELLKASGAGVAPDCGVTCNDGITCHNSCSTAGSCGITCTFTAFTLG